MTILYFTATGNSLYVAKSLGGELLSIPQMIKAEKYEFTDDKIGVVFPVYEWAVNTYVTDFLKKCKFNTEYLFAVATYGIFSGGVATHLKDIAKTSSFEFSYIGKVKMVDNYLPGFSMKKQIEGEDKKQIEKQIADLKQDIQSKKSFVPTDSLVRKKLTGFMVNRAEKEKFSTREKGIKKTVNVEDSCIKCGTCVKVCPVGNITLDSKTSKPTFANKCFSCYACLQNCPKNSIHLKNERDRTRFRNKHTTLKDIVDSNL